MSKKTDNLKMIEYLVTYGWAILAIVIVFLLLWGFGFFNNKGWVEDNQTNTTQYVQLCNQTVIGQLSVPKCYHYEQDYKTYDSIHKCPYTDYDGNYDENGSKIITFCKTECHDVELTPN